MSWLTRLLGSESRSAEDPLQQAIDATKQTQTEIRVLATQLDRVISLMASIPEARTTRAQNGRQGDTK